MEQSSRIKAGMNRPWTNEFSTDDLFPRKHAGAGTQIGYPSTSTKRTEVFPAATKRRWKTGVEMTEETNINNDLYIYARADEGIFWSGRSRLQMGTSLHSRRNLIGPKTLNWGGMWENEESSEQLCIGHRSELRDYSKHDKNLVQDQCFAIFSTNNWIFGGPKRRGRTQELCVPDCPNCIFSSNGVEMGKKINGNRRAGAIGCSHEMASIGE